MPCVSNKDANSQNGSMICCHQEQLLLQQLPSCSVSNPVSRRDLLTCDDASCLTRCHRAFVSNSCHFFRTPLSIPWRQIQSLRDADQPVRKVPSRDGYPARRWEVKDPAAQRIWHHQSW